MQLEDAETALCHILSMPIETHAAQTLVEDAVRLCTACGCTVYDGIYLALATRQGCPLITADERLANQARAAHLTVEILLLQQVQD